MCSESNLAQYNKNIQNNNDNILSQRQYFNSNNMYEEEKTNIKTQTLQNLLSMEQFKKNGLRFKYYHFLQKYRFKR